HRSLRLRRLLGSMSQNLHPFSPWPETTFAAPDGELYRIPSTSRDPSWSSVAVRSATRCLRAYKVAPVSMRPAAMRWGRVTDRDGLAGARVVGEVCPGGTGQI